jgi:hypothetical protein
VALVHCRHGRAAIDGYDSLAPTSKPGGEPKAGWPDAADDRMLPKKYPDAELGPLLKKDCA